MPKKVRKCATCFKTKPLDAFYKKKPRGRQKRCKVCWLEAVRTYQARRREDAKALTMGGFKKLMREMMMAEKRKRKTNEEVGVMSEKTKVNDPDAAMNEAQAAEFLGYSRSSLNQWRVLGKGPKYFKYKSRSIRYRRCDLIAWRDEQSALVQSTAETKAG